jgi:uncharacterized membrane protein YqaE (UPF0057 family)
LASCSTSSDVVDGGLFQKRKYNKGYHINKKIKINELKSVTENTDNEVAYTPVESVVSEDLLVSSKHISNPEVEEEVGDEAVQNTSNTDEVKSQSKETIKKTSALKTKVVLPILNNRVRNQVENRILNNDFFKSEVSETSGDVELIILIILAIFLPPIAVVLYEGVTSRFWITLILWLLAWVVGSALFGFGLAGLFSLLAIIYALLIVTGTI